MDTATEWAWGTDTDTAVAITAAIVAVTLADIDDRCTTYEERSTRRRFGGSAGYNRIVASDVRNHVHALVDQLGAGELSALETLLQSMVDQAGRKLALAEIDDEPLTEEDLKAIAEGQEYFRNGGKGLSLEQMAAECGFSIEDIRKP